MYQCLAFCRHSSQNRVRNLAKSELFPYEKFRKAKKKKFPRLATYNLARNVILDHPYAQVN